MKVIAAVGGEGGEGMKEEVYGALSHTIQNKTERQPTPLQPNSQLQLNDCAGSWKPLPFLLLLLLHLGGSSPRNLSSDNQRTTIEVVSDDEKNNIDILPQDSTFKMDPKVILEPKRIQDKKKLT